jgi:hypothetical protein
MYISDKYIYIYTYMHIYTVLPRLPKKTRSGSSYSYVYLHMGYLHMHKAITYISKNISYIYACRYAYIVVIQFYRLPKSEFCGSCPSYL